MYLEYHSRILSFFYSKLLSDVFYYTGVGKFKRKRVTRAFTLFRFIITNSECTSS